MFNFTISSFNPPPNKHGIASPGMPWHIKQEGVQKRQIDSCFINGVELQPGQRQSLNLKKPTGKFLKF
jgi:hypothetical protein